jgi:hypothetical protein
MPKSLLENSNTFNEKARSLLAKQQKNNQEIDAKAETLFKELEKNEHTAALGTTSRVAYKFFNPAPSERNQERESTAIYNRLNDQESGNNGCLTYFKKLFCC